MTNCKTGNEQMLRQIENLLSLVDSEAYSQPLELFNGSSIGQHVRHILNFYQALLDGVNIQLVDYAQRERDPRVESDPLFAREIFRQIALEISGLEESNALYVHADFFPEEEAERPLVQSSVGRELMFAFDHAVHHLAIIKIGLRIAQPDLPVAYELGIAPSTLKYQKGQHSPS